MTEVSVVIGVGAYCNWREVEPLLGQLSTNRQVHTIELDALASTLTKHPEYCVVLLYSDFSYALSQILQTANIEVSEAIEEWKSNLIALQKVYRSHRSQVLLFELNDVLANPESFLTLCLERLGRGKALLNIDFNTKNTIDEALTYDLAQAYLAKYPLLAQVNQYALAMAWPLSSETPDTELEIEQRLQQLKQFFVIKDKYQQLSNSVVDLQRKIVELEKIKSNYSKNEKELKSNLDQQQKKINQLTESEKKLNTKNNHLLEENTLLLEQLHVVQEELEKKFIVEKTLHKQQQEIQKERDQLKKKLNEEQEIFTKKQEQLQKKSDAARAEEEGLIAENRVLLEQLHLAQEELEIHYLEKKEADKKALAKAAEKAAHPTPSTETALMMVEQPKAEPTVYRSSGFLERRAQRKATQRALRKAAERASVIEKSAWFDKDWYLEQNPDVAADTVQASNPALHYIRRGGFEGRKPSPNFDSAFYLQENPDVAESGINPLWHFLQNGQAEGRQPHP